MFIRLIQLDDIDRILQITKEAIDLMKNTNQFVQWNENYPNRDTFTLDYNKQIGYVLIDKSTVEGYFSLQFGEDETYKTIYDGEFKTLPPYGVVHRLMISEKLRGRKISKFLLEAAIDICRKNNVKSIRIDTHEDNLAMRSIIKSVDFEYAGIIKVADGTKRLAFERMV